MAKGDHCIAATCCQTEIASFIVGEYKLIAASMRDSAKWSHASSAIECLTRNCQLLPLAPLSSSRHPLVAPCSTHSQHQITASTHSVYSQCQPTILAGGQTRFGGLTSSSLVVCLMVQWRFMMGSLMLWKILVTMPYCALLWFIVLYCVPLCFTVCHYASTVLYCASLCFTCNWLLVPMHCWSSSVH
jgi:hypothetical protein